MRLKKLFKRLLGKIGDLINGLLIMINHYRVPKFAYIGDKVQIGLPIICTAPQNVFLHEETRINPGAKIISYTGKLIVKKYTEIAYGCTIVTGNHTPTVGIPQYVLGHSHLNDKEEDVVIQEDVWIGANVTILKGVTIGRGAVVGANTLVNKSVPPYAVVAGVPAHIIASKFTEEQIIRHERALYRESERLNPYELKSLFQEYFQGKRSLGMN